ncbi:hypothetical protein C0585_03530 [Candidatus Woesearchaeota archaeon]|nr:MAG: hypothetical protein C0585_03530 [Candidatus Woesearchaeota archaeon]
MRPELNLFKPFSPGEEIIIPPSLQKNSFPKLKKIGETTHVETPSRLCAIVFDLLGITDMPPKTGGNAYAADFYKTGVTISNSSDKGINFENKYSSEIHNMYEIMKQLLNINPNISVKLESHELAHSGLGSTSAKVIGFAVGLNEMYGKPLTNYQLRQLIGYNHAETSSHDEKKLVKGFSFGTSGAVSLYGGTAIMAPNYEIIAHTQIPQEFSIMSYTPSNKIMQGSKGLTPEQEQKPIEAIKKHEILYAGKRTLLTMHELIPTMNNNNFEKHAEVMWELVSTMIPSFKGLHGDKYANHIIDMYNFGAMFPCQSSTGPNIFFYCKEKDEKKFRDYLINNGLVNGEIMIGKTSRGLEFSIDNGPIENYFFQGKIL